jgi:hypothetical protein
MEGLFTLLAIVVVLATLDAFATAFGAESRETFVDPRRSPTPGL